MITRAFRWLFRRGKGVSPEPRLVFYRPQWDAMIEELGRRGLGGKRESGAFLLIPKRGDGRTVTRVVYLDDLDPHCLVGGIHLHGEAYPKLWSLCDAEELRVIADIHTHPGTWVCQSDIDRDNPMVARRGHLALIAPELATRPVAMHEVGVHEYRGNRRMDLVARNGCVFASSNSGREMSPIDAVGIHRTVKIEIDDGSAATVEQAEEIARHYVLQIDVGAGIAASPTLQTILLTAVNTGMRAFLGGVRVRVREEGPTTIRWGEGATINDAVKRFGATVVDDLEADHPTIVIGVVAGSSIGSVVIHATWEGWSGGVVENAAERLAESSEFPPAGVLAGGFGVSEAFQHVRRYAVAGRRAVGLSLWRPDADWRDPTTFGPTLHYLPSAIWLAGLGHLGQAYMWTIGCLAYPEPEAVQVMLQDFDYVVDANLSTGMLLDLDTVGRRKARVIAERVEALGFSTTITERRFDKNTKRRGDEPGLAFAGFDDPAPRRQLEEAGFDLIVDAGLGGGKQNYLEILVHAFPSAISAADAWPERPSPATPPPDQPAYEELGQRLAMETDLSEGDIECGILEIAGRSVGAAFVGCVAAAIVISESLRALAGGPRYQVVSISLRSPAFIEAVSNDDPGPPVNPGFVTAELSP